MTLLPAIAFFFITQLCASYIADILINSAIITNFKRRHRDAVIFLLVFVIVAELILIQQIFTYVFGQPNLVNLKFFLTWTLFWIPIWMLVFVSVPAKKIQSKFPKTNDVLMILLFVGVGIYTMEQLFVNSAMVPAIPAHVLLIALAAMAILNRYLGPGQGGRK